MSNYPDYRVTEMGFAKESDTIGKDEIIDSLTKANKELESKLSLVKSIISGIETYASVYLPRVYLDLMRRDIAKLHKEIDE